MKTLSDKTLGAWLAYPLKGGDAYDNENHSYLDLHHDSIFAVMFSFRKHGDNCKLATIDTSG